MVLEARADPGPASPPEHPSTAAFLIAGSRARDRNGRVWGGDRLLRRHASFLSQLNKQTISRLRRGGRNAGRILVSGQAYVHDWFGPVKSVHKSLREPSRSIRKERCRRPSSDVPHETARIWLLGSQDCGKHVMLHFIRCALSLAVNSGHGPRFRPQAGRPCASPVPTASASLWGGVQHPA
jgi:hypothetical protein